MSEIDRDVAAALKELGRRHALESAAEAEDGLPDYDRLEAMFVRARRVLVPDSNHLPEDVASYAEGWNEQYDRLARKTSLDTGRYGERLQALVEDSGMTPDQVAEIVGISRGYIYKVFRADCNPTLSVIRNILGAIGATWGDLD